MEKEKSNSQNKKSIELEEVPASLVRIYSFIAVILILIPEWIAEATIALKNTSSEEELPGYGEAWEICPDLKLAKMTFYELRFVAKKLNIQGYARETRNELSIRILKHLKQKNI